MEKTAWKNIIIISVVLLVFVGATLALLPYITRLATEEGRAQFSAWIDSLGFGGWLVTLGIQILQVIFAFLPGEPVELMLGVLWGPWLGTFTCLLGIFIGTLLIFFAVRKLGMPFVKKIVGERDLTRYNFLRDPVKIDITVFILFFIPGTPKDALTYIVPLMPMRASKYLLISTFARIPSVVTSTILGDSIINGDYLVAVIVFVITALISLGGILFHRYYISRRKSEDGKSEDDA